MLLFAGLPFISLGALTFLAPLTLVGLIVLPLIWWLLRVTPPSPKKRVFPPLRILQDVVTEEETPDSTPLWLLLFRLFLMALIVFALAQPLLTQSEGVENKPVTLVIDNGWDAAANWSDIVKESEARIADARRKNVDVLMLATAEENTDVTFSSAEDAMRRMKRLKPRAFPPDHAQTAETLSALDIDQSELLWLSSGLNFGQTNTLGDAVLQASRATRLAPNSSTLPIVPGRVEETPDGLRSTWWRVNTNSLRSLDIIAQGGDGNVISRTQLTFAPGAKQAEAKFELPAELRNRITLLRADGVRTAGSVKLLDDSWGRPLIGILTTGDDGGSPLLSEDYYAETALQPYADIFEGRLEDLLPLSPSIIIMPDQARTEDAALSEFVKDGGLLIRFAGPKLAKRRDALLPVMLRDGGRNLGGALTWQDPQTLENFPADSPFYGLTVPTDIRVNRQVMAQPGAETDARTWARLEDGSPVVTSAPLGLGRVVLFHVTAGPEWSNLAVGGLYVDMLRRLLPLARATVAPNVESKGDWVAERVLDGFGRLGLPGATVTAIPEDGFSSTQAREITPPGFYRQGARRRALATLKNPESVSEIGPIRGVTTGVYGQTQDRSLSGTLLGLALCLLGLDALIALTVSGRVGNLKRISFSIKAKSGLASCVLAGVFVLAPHARAQSTSPNPAALSLYFAYVETGDVRIDQMSEAALEGLSEALTRRTTIEPNGVHGVDLATDPLVFYPFLYFPVLRDAPTLSPEARSALNAYMASGGTVVFDTQDAGDQAVLGNIQHPGLKRITEALDIPTIGKVPEDHVLTKSFYLIQDFPGRWANGSVWVDKNRNGASRDGVSSVIIGANDWPAAWARSDDGTYLATLENDIPRQREMSLRFGVNLAMYALAGNYKADQVHAKALVERLGDGMPRLEDLSPYQGPQD